jgi:hypothetical protein
LTKYGHVHGGQNQPAERSAAAIAHEQANREIARSQHHIHLPWPSYYPIITALGIALALGGLLFLGGPDDMPLRSLFPWVSLVGVIILLFGSYGWSLEPIAE